MEFDEFWSYSGLVASWEAFRLEFSPWLSVSLEIHFVSLFTYFCNLLFNVILCFDFNDFMFVCCYLMILDLKIVCLCVGIQNCLDSIFNCESDI